MDSRIYKAPNFCFSTLIKQELGLPARQILNVAMFLPLPSASTWKEPWRFPKSFWYHLLGPWFQYPLLCSSLQSCRISPLNCKRNAYFCTLFSLSLHCLGSPWYDVIIFLPLVPQLVFVPQKFLVQHFQVQLLAALIEVVVQPFLQIEIISNLNSHLFQSVDSTLTWSRCL